MRRVAVVVLLALIASGCQVAWLELASRDISGDGANGDSSEPALSADGRFVAFTSDADDLVPGDTNGVRDVFIRDLQTGSVELISVGVGGAPADGESSWPSISADGSRVSFHSRAQNLVPGDLNGVPDVFVRDRTASTTVSASLGLWVGGSAAAFPGAISGDGSTVWFGVAVLAPFFEVAFGVYDVATGGLGLTMESLAFFVPEPLGHGSVSHDGRYAAVSATFGTRRVFRIDHVTDTIYIVTEHDDDSVPAAPCFDPAISADGARLAFVCATDRIMPGAPLTENVYIHDVDDGDTTRASVDGAGGDANGPSFVPSLSTDGAQVAFQSSATDLVPNDMNSSDDVFVRDLDDGTTTRVSLDVIEVQGIHGSPSLSDGEFVAFTSTSNEIVPGDADITMDVLVRAVHAPDVISATPADVSPGSSATLTLAGGLFQPDAIVEVLPDDAITIDSVVLISSSELRVTVTVGSSAVAGPRKLKVVTPGPGLGIFGRIGSSDSCDCLEVL